MKKKILSGLTAMMMLVPATFNVQAKSSSTKWVDQFVSAYKKGNYTKAKAAINKMSGVCEEPCAYKMSSSMKKAYKAVVQSYINRYSDDWSYENVDENKTTRVDGYALSDVDGDGKAELFVATMDLYARPSTFYNVYTFKKNKAVRIGKNLEMLDGSLHAYPNKKGTYFYARDHSALDLKKGVIKNGKFKWQTIKFGAKEGGKVFYQFYRGKGLRMYLSGHYDQKKHHVDLSMFK
jgi:hypothetical protein